MKKSVLFACIMTLFLGASAQAAVLDLSSFSHGDYVASVDGVGITVDSNGGYSGTAAMIFNSNFGGFTPDPDLIFGSAWASGNIVNENLGNLLIIPDDNNQANINDEAAGGSITFDFSSNPITNFRLDYVDFEEASLGANFLTFTSQGGAMVTQTFGDLVPLFGSFDFGNRSANRIKEISAADLGFVDLITEVKVLFPGSGAITTVATNVPLPGAVWLLGSGLLGLVGLRRFRRK